MAKRVKKSKRKHPYLRVFIFALCAAALSLGVYLAVDALGISQWQKFDVNKIINAQQSMHIYDKDGTPIALLSGSEKRQSVPLSQVPEKVRYAFIAAEDARFFKHKGIDVKRILGALWVDIKSGDLKQGASTISQQLIKLSHLTSDKTWSRKLQEAYLAYEMEKQYSKNDILEMYLNFIYFGKGAYGIQAAAQTYFGKSVEDLTLAEGALIAGIIKSPSQYAPHLNLEKSTERRNLILRLMAEQKFITEEEAEIAKQEPVTLKLSERDMVLHGYFVDEAMLQAETLLGIPAEDLISGGYHIQTTMDQHMQMLCEQAMAEDRFFPQNAEDGTRVEGALIALDPRSGEIRAMVGGRSYETRRGFNRSVRLKRQPGSTIKPVLVYAPALQSGLFSPTSFILDEATDFNGYAPQNFGGKFSGWVTLRTAVAKSLNIPAVKMLSEVGIPAAKSYAESVGIPFSQSDNHLALALGGFEQGVSPLSLAGSYQPFASSGIYHEPYLIRRIEDANGRVLYNKNINKGKSVLSAGNAFIMADLLSSVVEEGTAKALQEAGVPLSAKSGTVDEPGVGNRDIWMVAFNPETVFTLWMGYDAPSKTHFIPKEWTGGTLPAQMLAHIYAELYPDGNAPSFYPPPGLEQVKLDRKALERQRVELATSFTPEGAIQVEYFAKGQTPTQPSQFWQPPAAPGRVSVDLGNDDIPVISFTAKDSQTVYRVTRITPYLPDTILAEVSGKEGERLYVSDYVSLQFAVEYAITPTRPDIIVNGAALTGASTYARPQSKATPTPDPMPALPILPSTPSPKVSPLPTVQPASPFIPSASPKPSPKPTPTPRPSPSPSPSGTPESERPFLPLY